MSKVIKVLVLLLVLTFCKESKQDTAQEKPAENTVVKEKVSINYIVTFAIGKATANGKPIRSGDLISGEPKFFVPGSSQVDIQITGLQTEVRIRIKSGTELHFYSRIKGDNLELVSFIKKGDLLYSVGKLNKGEAIVALTPLTNTGVRGTQFKVLVKEDGTSSIKVAEGMVATSYSTPALEALSNSDKVNAKTQGEINGVLGKPTIIEAGKEVSVNKKEVDTALKNDPELTALLNNPTLSKLNDPSALPKDPALESHLAEYEKKYATLEKTPEPSEQKLTIAESKETEAIKKESSEIVAITLDGKQSEAEIKKAVQDNIKTKSAELTKTVEKVFGKSSETLKLIDGTKVRGVIIQQGGDYIIQTPEGEKRYKEDQVEGFVF